MAAKKRLGRPFKPDAFDRTTCAWVSPTERELIEKSGVEHEELRNKLMAFAEKTLATPSNRTASPPRPIEAPADSRNHNFCVRIRSDQFGMLTDAAKRVGIPKAEMLRRVWLGVAKRRLQERGKRKAK